MLRLAASADQLSPHVLAEAVVAEARARDLPLPLPRDVREEPGRGVEATVDGSRPGRQARPRARRRLGADGGQPRRARRLRAGVGRDRRDPVGAILLKDPLRADAGRTLRRLRSAGIQRLVMLTGDRTEPAREVGRCWGWTRCAPSRRRRARSPRFAPSRQHAVTVMVGDGLNDAPALAAATVGVAMGARGSTASSEAADVVLTTDRLDRLADAMEIARYARRIAVQSAVAGMALSLAAMGLAAFGLLPPAFGALLQEAIDVAVILNALRALRGGQVGGGREARPGRCCAASAPSTTTSARCCPLVRAAADALAAGPNPQTVEALHRARTALVERLVPHEEAEEAELYPALSRTLAAVRRSPR